MIKFYNPALTKESLNEPPPILWRQESESILNLLKRTNRFKSDEPDQSNSDHNNLPEDLEDIMGISMSHPDEESV